MANRVEARERLRREHDLTEAIVDTNVAAIAIVGADVHISFADKPAGVVSRAAPDEFEDGTHLSAGTLRALDDTELSSRLQSSILANVSHDVRTPLSSTLNLIELLSMKVEEEHQEHIEPIERSGHRLLDTIDSVLDPSKLESGTVVPDWETVDLVYELLGTTKIFRPQTKEADLALETDVEESLTSALEPTTLHRILDNLISNAVKFTSEVGAV